MKKGVTVIVSCYNYSQFLSKSIESVLRQTLKPNAIIIIDDASTDSTKTIAKKFLKKYPKFITYIRNTTNKGTADTYNRAIRQVKTTYYSILDADDEYDPTFLEKTVNVVEQNKGLVLVYSNFELFGPRAESVYFEVNEQKYILNNKYVVDFPQFVSADRLIRKNFIHNSSLVRTEYAKKVGLYKTKAGYELDHYFFYKLLTKYPFAKKIDEPLLRYRQHSITQTSSRFYINEIYKNPYLLYKSKKQIQNEYELLEKKILKLNKDMFKITSSKFYRLWQWFCKKRDSLLK